MGEVVRERPILFSGPMVRAIFEDRKTQTRRPILPRKGERIGFYTSGQDIEVVRRDLDGDPMDAEPIRCPYGIGGDRLWVRETWAPADRMYGRELDTPQVIAYPADMSARGHRADGSTWSVPKWDIDQWNWDALKRKPSIFLPRWASRLTLEVIRTRPERLQAITEADSRAEGFASRQEFLAAWDRINGKRAPVASDLLVWVVEFRRVTTQTSVANANSQFDAGATR